MANKTSGNRLDAQAYCIYCPMRIKTEEGTRCLKSGEPITDAMKTCQLLVPFKAYKADKQNESKHSN